ncbi:MAG: hypothetical protein PUP93_32165 [Rhizonema sp. NSF051]|nr:hypothetical protein [Rhizonema sp. NSF051]
MQRRCDRNRKRSKRRAIYCPIHECYLHSVSPKYSLFADRVGQLLNRGVKQQSARRLMATKTTVLLEGEWLEGFWCDDCNQTTCYHIQKSDRTYHLSVASPELWQQAVGVMNPEGNPSVGEFTRKHARNVGYNGSKDFQFRV